jgi:hypothetical protein
VYGKILVESFLTSSSNTSSKLRWEALLCKIVGGRTPVTVSCESCPAAIAISIERYIELWSRRWNIEAKRFSCSGRKAEGFKTLGIGEIPLHIRGTSQARKLVITTSSCIYLIDWVSYFFLHTERWIYLMTLVKNPALSRKACIVSQARIPDSSTSPRHHSQKLLFSTVGLITFRRFFLVGQWHLCLPEIRLHHETPGPLKWKLSMAAHRKSCIWVFAFTWPVVWWTLNFIFGIPDQAPSGSSLLSLSSKKNLVYWHFLKTITILLYGQESPNGHWWKHSWPLITHFKGDIDIPTRNLKALDSFPNTNHSTKNIGY